MFFSDAVLRVKPVSFKAVFAGAECLISNDVEFGQPTCPTL